MPAGPSLLWAAVGIIYTFADLYVEASAPHLQPAFRTTLSQLIIVFGKFQYADPRIARLFEPARRGRV